MKLNASKPCACQLRIRGRYRSQRLNALRPEWEREHAATLVIPEETIDIQEQRLVWFGRTFDSAVPKRAKPLHSAHTLLLEVDLRKAFCAGAWISTIVLACAAIEADLRQIEASDFNSRAIELFGSGTELAWLRELRNEIMHAREPGTKSAIWQVEGHDISETHASLEDTAKRAVIIMFKCIYAENT